MKGRLLTIVFALILMGSSIKCSDSNTRPNEMKTNKTKAAKVEKKDEKDEKKDIDSLSDNIDFQGSFNEKDSKSEESLEEKIIIAEEPKEEIKEIEESQETTLTAEKQDNLITKEDSLDEEDLVQETTTQDELDQNDFMAEEQDELDEEKLIAEEEALIDQEVDEEIKEKLGEEQDDDSEKNILVAEQDDDFDEEDTVISNQITLDENNDFELMDSNETYEENKILNDNKKAPKLKYESYSYFIKKGDSLSKIAKNYYGKYIYWKIIYEKNKDILGKNPNRIYPNQKIMIPKIDLSSGGDVELDSKNQ